MEGKKRGPKGLGLSESAKKERKKEQDRMRCKQNKFVVMSIATHDRWVSLGQKLGLTSRALAVELLDAVDDGRLKLATESRQATPRELDTRRGEISPGVPEALLEMSASFLPPQHFSSPKASSCPVDKPATASSSDTRSAISGIEELGGDSPGISSDEATQAGEERSKLEATCSVASGDVHSSDDNLDVSVVYKVKGDYIYPEDLELEDDESDEDYDFEADLEAEFALTNRGCEGLAVLAVGDEIFEIPVNQPPQIHVEEDQTRSGLHHRVNGEEEAAASKFHLVEESELMRLSTKFHEVCPTCKAQPLEISLSPSGSATHILWTCPSGHVTKMCTQRTVNRVHTGDLKMAAGLVLSGNNYAKIAMMARQVGFRIPNQTTFYQLQNKYICPAVSQLADNMMAANISKHAANEEGVVLLGDGRNDSPGHTAQYLTYVVMEEASKDIVHAAFKDKRQTGRVSTRMEPVAFFETLEMLEEKGMKIKEFVTDAHPEITSKMRTKRPAIKHSHDTWHGGKNLGKKLTKISAKAANRPLIPWTKDIVNHWWFCSQTCESSETLFKEKWRGLLHHIVDEHSWGSGGGVGTGQCEHGELEQQKAYLEKGSPPHAALAEVVMDRTLLKKVPYYINFRHTGELESVNNHILMYCSKRFSFRYPGYKCRNLLAMIDYQHHKDRAVVLNADGTEKHAARWSKRSNDYVPVKVRAPKTYDYIPDLIKDIMVRRLTDSTPLSKLLAPEPDDPRLVAPRLAPHSPPPVPDLLKRRHVRRFEPVTE